MVLILMLCPMLFRTGAQTSQKPVIENERVVVWDVTDPKDAQPFDAVVVSLSGTAEFLPKGTVPKATGRAIVIELKDHPLAPIENPSGFPLAFPRPGSKKILENARVIVWDYPSTLGVATPMHFHDKDAVGVYLDDGEMQSTTPDGKVTVHSDKFGTVKFYPRDRTHTETLIRGKQRAIITELK
jgi:hypothetical protein